MANLKLIIGILAIILILVIVGIFVFNKSPNVPVNPNNQTNSNTNPTNEKSCNVPSDCGSFYDCINSKCVAIAPPSLP